MCVFWNMVDSLIIRYIISSFEEPEGVPSKIMNNILDGKPGTSKTGFGQVKIIKEFSWINRKCF